MFSIILQGWGFRDQNKVTDAFLASYYIGRGRSFVLPGGIIIIKLVHFREIVTIGKPMNFF